MFFTVVLLYSGSPVTYRSRELRRGLTGILNLPANTIWTQTERRTEVFFFHLASLTHQELSGLMSHDMSGCSKLLAGF